MPVAASTLARFACFVAALCTLASCGGQALEPAPGASGGSTAPDAAAPDATSPGWTQQLGVYGDCSYSDFGFVTGTGGAITLTRGSAGKLTLTYGAAETGARTSFSLSFDPTSGTSASLDPPDQTIPWELLCWSGPPITDSGLPIDPASTSVTLRLTAAALTYDAETVYLSVVGDPEIDATCEGRAAGTITCSRE